ncbi:MAG: hypothetical protein Q8Q59_15205 [Luteolibacter sp.]|jgi:hypothetical protein|nr:hypothetical protein [Luteolibacter sp.]
MDTPEDLKRVHISFLQWYCNPLELALLRTVLFMVILLLLAGTVAAAMSGVLGQAALMGGIALVLALMVRRTVVQVFATISKGGADIYIKDGADHFEIGTHPSQIMRIDKNAVIRKNGVFGVVNIQVRDGLFNLVIPRGVIT